MPDHATAGRQESQYSASSSTTVKRSSLCYQYQYPEIQLATNDFHESRVIGRGGFGKVYRGTIYDGSTYVDAAFKRLDSSSNQGAPEFWAEVEMLSKLRHCHLVSLFGYCNHGREMILVYEYMPNGTLADHLYKRGNALSWLQRLKICIGAARGLDYLHTGTGIESGVIHRDVKSSNILLCLNWAAKISDLGLSRRAPTNQSSSGVNTLVKGTFGYFDPQYYATGRLTRKSDVYAFGVVLLEILCRKRAADRSLDVGLATWALDSIKAGHLEKIIDPEIRGQISKTCLKKFVQISKRCVNSHPDYRPTMAEVVVTLVSVLTLQEKSDGSSQQAGRTMFGRVVNMFPFPSKGENTAKTTDNTASKTMDITASETMDISSIVESLQYDYDSVLAATDGFSDNNELAHGRFWHLYKGKLPYGQKIAVKKYDIGWNYLQNAFKGEIVVGAKLQHHNLIRLLGVSIDPKLLIFEFMPNGRLDQLIFDPNKRAFLDWERRYHIIKGVAHGLLYLHEDALLTTIHRDFKASNVFLDAEMNPKIADFGFARFLNTDCLIVDTGICGTIGYMAPEYIVSGILTTKVDVFSFGVLVLEIITGRRCFGDDENDATQEHIRSCAWRCWHDNTVSDMVDPTLMVGSSSSSLQEIMRSIHIALLCTQRNPAERPTMASVLLMFNSFSLTLQLPSNDSQCYWEDSTDPETTLEEYTSPGTSGFEEN